MSKIALATAVVALTAAVPLTMGRAEAQSYLAPGAAPPWGTTATTTIPETKPVPTPAATPATQPPRTSVESGTTTPIRGTATPIQGTTTPIQAVSLRSGPNTGSPVIGTLRPGMVVQVLASANYGWMQVETPAGSGWTYGSYLAPVGSTVGVEDPAPPQEINAR
jgi:Bacterial SH3 domain